jgi:hypothetical protein
MINNPGIGIRFVPDITASDINHLIFNLKSNIIKFIISVEIFIMRAVPKKLFIVCPEFFTNLGIFTKYEIRLKVVNSTVN